MNNLESTRKNFQPIIQNGINRVKRAIFAKAYGDEGLIARMSESTDENVRGVLHNYDLSAISDAATKKIAATLKKIADACGNWEWFAQLIPHSSFLIAKTILLCYNAKNFGDNDKSFEWKILCRTD